jgi:hypothetical protein
VIPGYSLLLVCVLSLQLHTRPRVQRAPGIPHALQGAEEFINGSGASRGEIVNPRFNVIARSQRVRPSAGPMINSATKQSILPLRGKMDCFVARAPRNDVERLFEN